MRTNNGHFAHNGTVLSSSLEPWFPPHLERDIYLSLLHLEPEPGKDKPPAVPDSILKAALLSRALEDIKRILEIRNGKQALGNLLQRGSVGDDLWQRFLRAEQEAEAELRDVVEEVDPGRTCLGVLTKDLTGFSGKCSTSRVGFFDISERQRDAP